MFACNAYIDEQAPWALRKTDPERMETVLATLYICIAVLAVGDPAGHSRRARTDCSTRWASALELRTFEGILGHWYSPLAESEFRLGSSRRLFSRVSNFRRMRRSAA